MKGYWAPYQGFLPCTPLCPPADKLNEYGERQPAPERIGQFIPDVCVCMRKNRLSRSPDAPRMQVRHMRLRLAAAVLHFLQGIHICCVHRSSNKTFANRCVRLTRYRRMHLV